MRSLFSGVSGLKVHQTKMDVIANNISNVNTTAFKAGRVTFSDYFSQTLSGGQSGNATRGGINPMQVGLGANVASIDIRMDQGVSQRTDRNLDVMVSGEGFFIVGSGQNTMFTRDGNFGVDNYGNLVTTSGLNVMGWAPVVDPNNPGKYIPSKGSVKPIQITGDQQMMPPEPTKNLAARGNVNVVGDPNNPAAAIEHPTTFSFFDSIGNQFVVDAKYVWDPATQKMDLQIGDAAYLNGVRSDAYQLTVGGSGGAGTLNIDGTNNPYTPTGTYTSVGAVGFTDDGVLDPANSDASGLFTLEITGTALPADAFFGDGTGAVNLDLTDVTIFDNVGSDALIESLDGNPPGTLSDMVIAPDGSLMGMYTNGQQRLLAMIPLATFRNPSGLQRAGGNLFQVTANSGDFNGIGVAATDIGSSVASGQLEMSNVDIAQEFTDMIVTQRGFQANSKTISTSDEMLQELVNLKR